MVRRVFSIVCGLLFASGIFGQNPVAENGQLQVIGHQLCNAQGKAYQLRGMSTFGLMHYPQCISYSALKAQASDWQANVVRAAVFVADYSNTDNYNQNPNFNKALIDSMVTWTERLGIYCIIDWHVLVPGNPNDKEYKGADAFFDEMSAKYKNKKHIIYEICNEPSGGAIVWDSIAKYANRITPIIRKNDPSSIVLIGTPDWCKQLSVVDPTKLNDIKNVMYTFHFYAVTHKSLYAEFVAQSHRIPVFVSEWGTTSYTGNGALDTASSSMFLKAMKQHVKNNDTISISWCNFSFADKNETASALKPNSCFSGLWNNTTVSGEFIKQWIKTNSPPAKPATVPLKNNNQGTGFKLIPNPATDNVVLQAQPNETNRVTVFNLQGAQIIAPSSFEESTTLDISALATGTYLLWLSNNITSNYSLLVKK